MHNFKPSELPVGTIIDDQEEGTFYKDAPGEWAELQYLDAGTQAIVWDEGPTLQNVANFRGNVVQTPSDEYFKDFKILSVPLSVLEHMATEFSLTVEVDIRDFVMEESIKRVATGWGDLTPEMEKVRQAEAMKKLL